MQLTHDPRAGAVACHLIVLTSFFLLTSWFGDPRRVEAQSFSPYSVFDAMSQPALQTLQIQLTPVGPGLEELSSVTIIPTGGSANVAAFSPFRRPEFLYGNGAGTVFTATLAELEQLINNVGTLSTVTAGGVAATPLLSFAMVNSNGPVGFEAVVDRTVGIALIEQINLALAANPAGRKGIATVVCPLDLLPAGQAPDVTASVSTNLTGVRLDRDTGLYVGTLKVTNNSASPLATPVSVVLVWDLNVMLADADGTTCRTTPVGAQYLDLVGSIAPGASATVIVKYRNPDKDAILPTTIKVLAGPGPR